MEQCDLKIANNCWNTISNNFLISDLYLNAAYIFSTVENQTSLAAYDYFLAQVSKYVQLYY